MSECVSRDWRAEIVELVTVQQGLLALGDRSPWRVHFPRVAAGEREISAAEERLRVRLNPQFRSFLTFADGWPGFFQDFDLFGTSELSDDGVQARCAFEASLDESDFGNELGMDFDGLLFIGRSVLNGDVIVTGTRDGRQCLGVVWYAGGPIEQFDNFQTFFRYMIELNRREIRAIGG
ncbi:SMI1/KNR4 family protein [Luteimicrobium xylanilyticum]